MTDVGICHNLKSMSINRWIRWMHLQEQKLWPSGSSRQIPLCGEIGCLVDFIGKFVYLKCQCLCVYLFSLSRSSLRNNWMAFIKYRSSVMLLILLYDLFQPIKVFSSQSRDASWKSALFSVSANFIKIHASGIPGVVSMYPY